MYAATRVVLALKRRTGGYEDNRKLSEEEPVRPLFLSSSLFDPVEPLLTQTCNLARRLLAS